ncbi:hypothetical protein GGS23DRAFT_241758 [Durotheca rogersii]|uniref:uncharacterized protein n=1 Tax=Durotheca rogersii TaxID=419775 RepID=UPI00221E610A|nr:uncharacterized protein GGS23DRAFT_241758 [Durotheca rogersii]KAI5860259.1 hypothetical protein GGS23DRAFT_241758 [Durotheca rogersii]
MIGFRQRRYCRHGIVALRRMPRSGCRVLLFSLPPSLSLSLSLSSHAQCRTATQRRNGGGMGRTVARAAFRTARWLSACVAIRKFPPRFRVCACHICIRTQVAASKRKHSSVSSRYPVNRFVSFLQHQSGELISSSRQIHRAYPPVLFLPLSLLKLIVV